MNELEPLYAERRNKPDDWDIHITAYDVVHHGNLKLTRTLVRDTRIEEVDRLLWTDEGPGVLTEDIDLPGGKLVPDDETSSDFFEFIWEALRKMYINKKISLNSLKSAVIKLVSITRSINSKRQKAEKRWEQYKQRDPSILQEINDRWKELPKNVKKHYKGSNDPDFLYGLGIGEDPWLILEDIIDDSTKEFWKFVRTLEPSK